MTLENSDAKMFFKSMLAIALPIALQNLIAAGLNMVDTIMIGQLGEAEIAAVGLANQVTFLLHLFLFGISSGSAIFTAQYWGIRDVRNVRRILGISLFTGLSISLIFAMSAFTMPVHILRIFTKDSVVLALGSQYLTIIGISFIMMSISFTFASVLRSTGQVKLPMYISAFALLVNTVLNFLLILGNFGFPALGVRGAAIATVIARSLEVLLYLGIIYASKNVLAAKPKELFDLNWQYIRRVYRTVMPVVINESLWAVGVTMYIVVYARMGTDVVAAINIASTIERLAFVAFIGIANAAAVILGNQIGAGNTETAYRYGLKSAWIGPTLGIAVGLLLIAASPLVLSFYQITDSVYNTARGILIVYGLALPIRVFNMINIVGILRSGGDTRFTLFLDITGVWMISVPLAFLGGLVWGLPVQTVVILVILEELYKLIFGVRRFISRKWINRLTDPA